MAYVVRVGLGGVLGADVGGLGGGLGEEFVGSLDGLGVGEGVFKRDFGLVGAIEADGEVLEEGFDVLDEALELEAGEAGEVDAFGVLETLVETVEFVEFFLLFLGEFDQGAEAVSFPAGVLAKFADESLFTGGEVGEVVGVFGLGGLIGGFLEHAVDLGDGHGGSARGFGFGAAGEVKEGVDGGGEEIGGAGSCLGYGEVDAELVDLGKGLGVEGIGDFFGGGRELFDELLQGVGVVDEGVGE